jgi:hypothetical protein
MKKASELTVLVYGHGLEIPIAQRLAQDCKRVIYFSEWQEGFSTVNKASAGLGFQNIERCEDIWDVKDDVDLFMFPDVGHSGLQLELETQGYAVWGSRRADRLEQDREFFLSALEHLGLEVPDYTICAGIDELREHLRHVQDVFIKISWFRGTIETKHFRSWDLDRDMVDAWAVKLGRRAGAFHFIVCPAIETPLEIGGDTYCIDGDWPELMLHGIEVKDNAYLAAVTQKNKMPEAIQDVLEAFSEYFKAKRMRNFWSMEIRVKDEQAYFIDATPRMGWPSTPSQLELWTNYTDIVWHGANGILLSPVPSAKFAAELYVTAKHCGDVWPNVEIPEELDRWLKLCYCMRDGNVVSFIPDGKEHDYGGWLVAIGDTPTATLETIKEYVDSLPDGLTADIETLAEVIKEIDKEEEKGIEFTEQPMPEPEIVV